MGSEREGGWEEVGTPQFVTSDVTSFFIFFFRRVRGRRSRKVLSSSSKFTLLSGSKHQRFFSGRNIELTKSLRYPGQSLKKVLLLCSSGVCHLKTGVSWGSSFWIGYLIIINMDSVRETFRDPEF